jgi:hypothetical protein
VRRQLEARQPEALGEPGAQRRRQLADVVERPGRALPQAAYDLPRPVRRLARLGHERAQRLLGGRGLEVEQVRARVRGRRRGGDGSGARRADVGLGAQRWGRQERRGVRAKH